MDDAALLDVAIDLAWQAAGVILARRASGFHTVAKPDQSPVTDADHAAEAVIVRGLRAATPDIEVIAEEQISTGYTPRQSAAMWVVDPLDGTADFAADRDGFTVNIGLVRGGIPVLGVVAEPAAARLYGGIVGQFAFVRDGAGRRAMRARAKPAGGLRVLTSRNPPDAALLRQVLAGRSVASITRVSSALKFCRIAEGRADLYPRFDRSMEWDTAAGHAILLAAGGQVNDLAGAPLAYGKPEFVNGAFVASGL